MQAIIATKEAVYAQQMVVAPMPTSQHLALLRLTPEAASSTVEGVKNLFGMAEKYAGGNVTVETSNVGDAVVTTLTAPPMPQQLAVTCLGDVFVFCTSSDLMTKSLGMLTGGEGKSKFDDPRLAEALKHLPEAEDSVVFFDGKTMFQNLRGFGAFIKEAAAAQGGGDDENIQRLVDVIDIILDDVSILDYEVTVEYTEGNLNRSAAYGKLLAGTEDSTMRKMLESGQPFAKWQAWVPAGALSYSMGTGVNLHVAYERIMSVVKEKFPEANDALAEFERIQEQVGIHLDRDILQSFSGEYASVTLGDQSSVFAVRCENPDRIRELLRRGLEALQQIPQVKMLQLKFAPCKSLDGFEQLTAPMLAMNNIMPVIGARDGWLYIGTTAKAVQSVFDAQAGSTETIETTDAFKRLNLEIDGPVDSISYSNTAEDIRGIAQALRSVGSILPMVMAMAGGNMNQEDLKPIQEVLALLPDIAKIIEKFDFFEATITVNEAGEQPDSYVRRTVTAIRPPANM
ncbi:MAG: hypothetical protein FJ276_08225 [Planctomycetes bacterium]|nr:hypothetical protein [Planctomycetota bacterium]